MPLHLLGKKSWNVYNADNIARVRRDEAQAKAAEEAEEQRMQEVDAARRMAILRGEEPPPLEDEKDETPTIEAPAVGSSERLSKPWKKPRKRAGEDDTDFELRVASERTNAVAPPLETSRKPSSSAPIVDRAGHIDLFGDEKSRAHAEKNEEAEKEKAKKRREYEDQYTMRFSNAAGKSAPEKPWYSSGSADQQAATSMVPKDVWGNEDPRRKEREAQRTTASDPLAMMNKGAAKVREIKNERKKFQEERSEEMRQMRRDERRRERRDAEGSHRSRRRSRSRSRSPGHGSRRRRSRESHRHRSRERREDNDGHHRERSRDKRDTGRDRDRNRDRDRDEARDGRHRRR
ncbi:hypothetical protein K4F52_000475 [Lecanicillium sp. MT-2017a]|nr:hypothetical protein K4F52_000475 [Lecanicillium sp. MT-2017a]